MVAQERMYPSIQRPSRRAPNSVIASLRPKHNTTNHVTLYGSQAPVTLSIIILFLLAVIQQRYR